MAARTWISAAAVCLLLVGCAHHRHEEIHEAHMRSMGAASMAAMTPSLCNGQHCNVDVTVTCTSSAQCIQVAPMTLVVQNSAQPSIHFRMQSDGFQFDRITFDDPQFTCTPGPREVVCMDRHSSAGTFKYSVAVRGVAGVLDPWIVNN